MSKNMKFVLILAFCVTTGFAIWKLQNLSIIKRIGTFEECTKAGFPILETYPEQCRTPDGKTFTKKIQSQPQTELQQQTIEEIGLSFQNPKDLVFRKEIADDAGKIRTVGFFLTKGSENNPEYQLYGLYQQFKDATVQDLDISKKEMDINTIKDVEINDYKGIEGRILGPKTRYITIILKGKKLFSVSTYPPTPANKAITDQILSTFSFK